MMKNKENVCKFVRTSVEEKLKPLCFVNEKNACSPPTMNLNGYCAMHLVNTGRGRLYAGSNTWDLEPGSLFFTFESEPVGIENLGDLQYMYIRFGSEGAQPLFERFGISSGRRIFGGHEGLLTFWQSALNMAVEKNLDLISESVLLYTFAQLTPPEKGTEQYQVADILNRIEACFSDRTLTLESCAEKIGYHPKYISRIFSKNVGVTFSEYLTNTRIRHAVFLIDQGIISIKNIAILCGYSDPSYFSNVFKKNIGISPSEYIAHKNKRKTSEEKAEQE